jgi:DNA-binding response OmpR family regulator
MKMEHHLELREIHVNNKIINLSPHEASVFDALWQKPNEVVSRFDIELHAWGERAESLNSNVVEVYIGYLRRKLAKAGLTDVIVCVRGKGYKLEVMQ